MAGWKDRFLYGSALVAIAGATAVWPAAASAQGASADQQVTVSIPPQRLSDALRRLAEATRLQLVYDTTITDGKAAPGVSGTLTKRAALAQMLAGSGLSFQFSGERSVLITGQPGAATAVAAEPGVRSVGVVSVEGSAGYMPSGELVSPVNGTNGSTDVEATEGTGSYTTGALTVGTKAPATIRETTSAVSVMTAQRIDDQNLVSAKEILERMPGVISTPGANSEEFRVFSRGF